MSDTNDVVAGRYHLAYRIAAGGVGEVWRAVDTLLDRPVAVKLLHATYAQHPETLARFRAEARHAGSLSHPGIARVYDYGEASPPHPPYLVMEVVDGPSLAGLLTAGPLDPAQAMDVVAQAAAGLAVAHRAGLVHRDIKPGNLLLGPGGQLKITDFGIAHAAGSAPLTRTGTVLGTPAYLAPERAAGSPAVPASDLYSLGIVAYEYLAGTPPFRGSPLDVATAHCSRQLPPLPGEVPQPVAALVADLTAKDPAGRLASAAEAAGRAGRLRDAMTGNATVWLPAIPADPEPVQAGAHPVTLTGAQLPDPPAAWRPQRRRAGLAVTAAVVVAGAAGLLLGTVLAAPQPQPAASTPPAAASTPAASASAGSPAAAEVNAGSLVGQPLSDVLARLRSLGLRPQVTYTNGGPPGTVLSVQPAGQVPAGSVVVVTAAQPPGHDHGNG